MNKSWKNTTHYNESSISSETVFKHLAQLFLVGLDSCISVEMSQHISQRNQRIVDLLLNGSRYFRYHLAYYFHFSRFSFRLHFGYFLSKSSIETC